MTLNLDKTVQSTITRSHSQTLAKYTNNNMPTVYARAWTNEKQPRERKDPQMCEKMRFNLRFDLNVLKVGV